MAFTALGDEHRQHQAGNVRDHRIAVGFLPGSDVGGGLAPQHPDAVAVHLPDAHHLVAPSAHRRRDQLPRLVVVARRARSGLDVVTRPQR